MHLDCLLKRVGTRWIRKERKGKTDVNEGKELSMAAM